MAKAISKSNCTVKTHFMWPQKMTIMINWTSWFSSQNSFTLKRSWGWILAWKLVTLFLSYKLIMIS